MQHIETIVTFVPVVTEEAMQRQLRKIAERDAELGKYGRNGFTLTHTATITGPEFTTFVDTLTRTRSED